MDGSFTNAIAGYRVGMSVCLSVRKSGGRGFAESAFAPREVESGGAETDSRQVFRRESENFSVETFRVLKKFARLFE